MLLDREEVGVFLAIISDDGDPSAVLLLLDSHHARESGKTGRTLWRACLEELNDSRKSMGDILARNTALVEGTHGQLGTRFADRLSCDHTDCLTEFDDRSTRE